MCLDVTDVLVKQLLARCDIAALVAAEVVRVLYGLLEKRTGRR